MITLERDGIVMEVATELQASVFIRSGYRRIEKVEPTAISEPETVVTSEPEKVEEKKPVRRRIRKKVEE